MHQEQQLRNQYESELAELRNRPPPVTPRQQNNGYIERSPSPPNKVGNAALNRHPNNYSNDTDSL